MHPSCLNCTAVLSDLEVWNGYCPHCGYDVYTPVIDFKIGKVVTVKSKVIKNTFGVEFPYLNKL